MTPIEILQNAFHDGVSITPDGAGSIRLVGDQSMVEKWLPAIRENKPAILAALSPRQTTPTICGGCTRLEAVEILGEAINGCLFKIPGAEYPDGWRRLPADIKKCIWQGTSKRWN